MGPKWPICPEQLFFGTDPYYYHHLPIGTFQCAKFLQKFLQQLQSHEDTSILNPKWFLCPKQVFFGKKYEHYFYIHTGPCYCEKFLKNSYSGSRVIKMHHFLGHEWLICNNENFFSENLSITLVPFIRACLNAKYQVRWWSIKEILMIKEYWNLIGQETFSTITWRQNFCQAFSLHRMLMNHKNSRFTAITDKTHDTIFSKSPKTVFLGHFGPIFVIFVRREFVLKNLLQFHPLIYGPRTPC